MECWRKVWREGFLPSLKTEGLKALRDALRSDDPRLMQGMTTSPAPQPGQEAWTCNGTCAVGFCGWQANRLLTVGEVEEYFARLCFEADHRLGAPAASRWFINWFDETPRPIMREHLLTEVERNLIDRDVPIHPARPNRRWVPDREPTAA